MQIFSVVLSKVIYSYCETIDALILSFLCNTHHVSVTKLFKTHMLIQRQCWVGFWINSVNNEDLLCIYAKALKNIGKQIYECNFPCLNFLDKHRPCTTFSKLIPLKYLIVKINIKNAIAFMKCS